jgi:hypothetical protein
MTVPVNPATHPATLSVPALLLQCEVRRQRRSGPGGQHRNKVETAVVLVHQPTGIRGEASERRSQAQNLAMAVQRLRVKLAIQVRSTDVRETDRSELWQSRVRGRQISISPNHEDFPALLAEALDVLSASEFDTKSCGVLLKCTRSQLVKFLKLEPEAFQMVNAQRVERELSLLR